MPNEDINNTGNENESENNDSNYDELDDLLNDEERSDDKEKKDESKTDDEKSNEDENKDKEEDESNKFFKKIGSHIFDNEKDYDDFVAKTYNTNSQLAGEVKKLGGNPKKPGEEKEDDKGKKDDAEVKKEKTPEESYYEIENIRFMKKFPAAKEYKEEMKASIKNGRANINDEPSYALAFAKALRGDGKIISDNLLRIIKIEKGEDPNSESQSVAKKIMRSGGRSVIGSNEPTQESYSKEDLEEVSNFGDKIALGGF